MGSNKRKSQSLPVHNQRWSLPGKIGIRSKIGRDGTRFDLGHYSLIQLLSYSFLEYSFPFCSNKIILIRVGSIFGTEKYLKEFKTTCWICFVCALLVPRNISHFENKPYHPYMDDTTSRHVSHFILYSTCILNKNVRMAIAVSHMSVQGHPVKRHRMKIHQHTWATWYFTIKIDFKIELPCKSHQYRPDFFAESDSVGLKVCF